MSQPKSIDRIDKRILQQLQQDGRISNVELARRVGLSPTPCLERVKRLERHGFIKNYQAILQPNYLDAGLLVFVEISLSKTSPDVFAEFSASAKQTAHVQECHLVSGDFDYLIKARVKDMNEYRKFLGEDVLTLPSVTASKTYVVMETVKESLWIDIDG